ncbi:glycoside hydrolase superfamily [Paraphysoderma sedebokerense]|nr:glycoside hydrolase superfamily [Paraphysoderma sedebokerense]
MNTRYFAVKLLQCSALCALVLLSNDQVDAAPSGSNGSNWVAVQDGHLKLNNCNFYFHGANVYFLPYKNQRDVIEGLDTAQRNGINVVRTWAFMDTAHENVQFQWFDASKGDTVINDEINQKYSLKGLSQLDMVIAEAKKRDIKLILPLVNNWHEFGGMDIYNDWFGGTYHDDFYTGTKQREAFKKYIRAVVGRTNTVTGVPYKDEPTIMAWELANEPRCKSETRPSNFRSFPPSPNCTAQTITTWAQEMSRLIKSIDSNHLVGLGDEGFGVNVPRGTNNTGRTKSDWWPFNNTDGIDFEKNLQIADIDFGTFHMYPEDWISNSSERRAFTSEYVKWHAEMAKKYKKPVIMEEYGSKDLNNRKSMFDEWHQIVRNDDLAGTMFWTLAVDQVPESDQRAIYGNAIQSLFGEHIRSMKDKTRNCR